MRSLKIALLTIFNPGEAFPLIQVRGKKFNYWPGFILFGLLVVARFFYLMNVSFQYQAIAGSATRVNFLLEISVLLLPLITWIFACYGVTTISSGETFIREIFVATAYATIPYTFSTLLQTGLSQFMTLQESGLFNTINSVFVVWMVILIFISVMRMNEFSFTGTLGRCILAVFLMFVIWALGFLVYGLFGQLVNFIETIIYEFRLSILE